MKIDGVDYMITGTIVSSLSVGALSSAAWGWLTFGIMFILIGLIRPFFVQEE